MAKFSIQKPRKKKPTSKMCGMKILYTSTGTESRLLLMLGNCTSSYFKNTCLA